MNAARSCHRVPGLEVLVDGFMHAYDGCRGYVLTHYHSDHTRGLSSSWSGGAIHCTPITGSLLVEVMGVSPHVVVTHDLKSPFELPGCRVTFLDANHCPGAAMVLFECSDGRTHLHTGDLRACTSMEEDALLQSKRIDHLYLDTTYAHPKHNFVPQEEAVASIVSAVQEKLAADGGGEDGGAKESRTGKGGKRWFFLFGAYSIGKERVLLAVARATSMKIYCSPKRLKIIRLLGLSQEDLSFFTETKEEGRGHVCGLHLCGTCFPYAKPNYPSMLRYMKSNGLDSRYDAVLGVIPTGWANGSKWNREHSFMMNEEGNAAVMFVPYSEHSSFPELMSLVRSLRPKKVVPTVYSDDKELKAIVKRFSPHIDITSVKKDFIAKMFRGSNSGGRSSGSGATASPCPPPKRNKVDSLRDRPRPWACTVCTYLHCKGSEASYLSCSMCGSKRLSLQDHQEIR